MTSPAIPLAPHRIAHDTYLIPSLVPAGPGAFVPINSMVILGAEPVIVDTGGLLMREQWLAQVRTLLDLEDVRWVFLSHDDADHTGNVMPILEAAPKAKVISTFFMTERMKADFDLPLDRLRWVNAGESFHVGDRTLHTVLPPLFDSPVTRGLFDPTSGVLWAADAFASMVEEDTLEARQVNPEMYRETFGMFNSMNSPWHQWLDARKWNRHVDTVQSLPLTAVASGHGPVTRGLHLDAAFRMARALAGMPVAPSPGQEMLDQLVAQVTAPSPTLALAA